MNRGLPGFGIVGLPNTTVNEARDRVRSAIVNSKLAFPARKITINLAPAELKKDGTGLDLPIALAILAVSGQFDAKKASECLFVGELSLNGEICAIPGVINVVEAAKNAGVRTVFVPPDNLRHARLVKGVEIRSARTLRELILVFNGEKLAVESESANAVVNFATQSKRTRQPEGKCIISKTEEAVFDDIRGQALAKRALTIAIAGRHNILLSGPPGTGKTMLARAAHALLPPLEDEELVAVAKLHGLTSAAGRISAERPFRTPHHSASVASLVGGGTKANPGEISLAHHGVLFLDELPEFPRNLIEALRQPLEDRVVTITRVNYKLSYPANFMLIATENPCPCGFLGDPDTECTCSQMQIANYRKKLSGPIRDRLDMTIPVERVPVRELAADGERATAEHDQARECIRRAMARQRERFGESGESGCNSEMSSRDALRLCRPSEPALSLMYRAVDRLSLSTRSYFKVLKVARTIADIEGSETVETAHITEALSYREGRRGG
jgi:magnesium chelatase family protein